MRRKRLGELLLDFGLVNEAQVQQALQNRAPGERVGEALVNQGFVSERALQKALAIHLKVPIVEVAGREIHPAILSIVPAEMAKRLGVLPIARQKKAQGESIYLATADPTNEYALQEVARHTNLAIEQMLAKPTELREAIERAYQTALVDEAPPIQVQRNDGKIPGFDTPSGGVEAPPAAVVGTLLESGGHVSPPETLLNVPASTIVEPEPLPLESIQPIERVAPEVSEDPEPLPLENIQPLVSSKTQAMTSPPSLDAARTLLVPAYKSPEENHNILVVPGPPETSPPETSDAPLADPLLAEGNLETLIIPAVEVPAPATMPTKRPDFDISSAAPTVPLKKGPAAADTLLDTPAIDLGKLPLPKGTLPQAPAMTMGFDRPDGLAEPMMPPPAVSVDVSSAVVPLADEMPAPGELLAPKNVPAPALDETPAPVESKAVLNEIPDALPEERTEMLSIAPPCPKCGADTVFQAKFCGQCGNPLNNEGAQSEEALAEAEPQAEDAPPPPQARPPLTVAETDALERQLGATWTTTAAGAADAVERIAGNSDGLSVLRTVLAPVTLAEATYSDEAWFLSGLPAPTSRHFAPALVNQTNADVAQADEPWHLVQGSALVESGEMTPDNLSHPWVRKTKISELTLTQLQALTERLFNAGALSQEDLDNAKDLR